MVALETPKAVIGWKAPDFKLKGTDGRDYALADVKSANGLLLVFMCNHCPYVQKQLDRLVTLAAKLTDLGVGMAGISSNDAEQYPEDSYQNMQKLAANKKFPFPYLYDATQEVARAYGAVCTPDFYGFNGALEMQYRGRLDQSWSGVMENPRQELLMAMTEIATDGKTALPQNPSIGCSIKWKIENRRTGS